MMSTAVNPDRVSKPWEKAPGSIRMLADPSLMCRQQWPYLVMRIRAGYVCTMESDPLTGDRGCPTGQFNNSQAAKKPSEFVAQCSSIVVLMPLPRCASAHMATPAIVIDTTARVVVSTWL